MYNQEKDGKNFDHTKIQQNDSLVLQSAFLFTTTIDTKGVKKKPNAKNADQHPTFYWEIHRLVFSILNEIHSCLPFLSFNLLNSE